MHLGNYLGAVKNWLDFQSKQSKKDEVKHLLNEYFIDRVINEQLLICVVDMHSLTTVRTNPNPFDLHNQVREMAICLMACGIDPAKTILFNQSKVIWRKSVDVNKKLGDMPR